MSPPQIATCQTNSGLEGHHMFTGMTTMRISMMMLVVLLLSATSGFAFSPAGVGLRATTVSRGGFRVFSCDGGHGTCQSRVAPLSMSATEEAPPVDTEVPQKDPLEDFPTNLPSDAGIDYVPLATMLATGDLKGADQFTRDALIKAAGEGSVKRGFVYWTEVKNIPSTDMATMENLWLRYSKGKFGYSVQRDVWRFVKGDFENFCRKVGWNTKDAEVERKLRWFGANEFIYDVDKAPKGHLPLTSALRGTTLLKQLFTHPVWDTEWREQ